MVPNQGSRVFPVIAVFIALIAGILVITDPGLAIPMTLQLIVLSAITFFLLARERDPQLSKWLRRLVIAALALRIVLAVFVHFGPALSPYFFAPDAASYEDFGRALAESWDGLRAAPPRISEGWRQSYFYANAAFIWLLGESTLTMVVFNVFAGIWTVLLTFDMTRRLVSLPAAKWTAVLTAFFPSLVLWSILNIRDSAATLMVVIIIWAGVRLNQHLSLRHLMVLAAGVIGLTALRDYMGFLVLAGLTVGSLVAVRPDRLLPRFLVGTGVAIAMTYIGQSLDLFVTFTPEAVLDTAQTMRGALQQEASSAFGVGVQTTTVGSAIAYLPLGASYLLLAPFPWAIDSALQLAAMPETLLWYPLLALAVVGFFRARHAADFAVLMIPLSVLVLVTISYALVEGNFGTAYRHRAQVMPLFFMFTGVGMQWFVARVLRTTPWARRAQVQRARERARREGPPPRSDAPTPRG